MNTITCPICNKQLGKNLRKHMINKTHIEYIHYLYNNNITEYNRIEQIYNSIT